MKNLLTSSFDALEFEEVEHKYTLDGRNLTSVSKIVENYAEKFSDDIAERYALKHNLNVEDVRKSWEDNNKIACDFGKSVHDFGEMYFYDKTINPKNKHESAIVKFWKEIPSYYIPIACESRIYTEKYDYAGTFDLLLFDEIRNGIVIVDYKTNKDLFKNFKGKLMLSPFDFMLDSPFNHYQLQLSLYQIPLEDIGITVLNRHVIWLQSDGTYNNYKTNDYTNYLRNNLSINN